MELRDPISSASHLLTAVWAAYATLVLIRITPGKSTHRLAVAVFGLSMVLLYLASGTFHGVPYTRTSHPAEFAFFQKLDQSAIFLLIAGTNTPCLVILLGGAWGRRLLRAMWLFAAAGIACLWLLPKAPHTAVVAIYMAMGWFGFLPFVHYYRLIGWRAMNWVLLGAGAYSLGAICELLEWPVISDYPVRFGFHEILHLCDIAGSLAFFVFITRYVVPFRPATEEQSEEQSELAAAEHADRETDCVAS
jgi:hemolysin III